MARYKKVKINMEATLNEFASVVKDNMDEINQNAVDDFYSFKTPYKRTNSFDNFVVTPDEKISKDGNQIDLIYRYKASDVTVNEWKSPWGITYPGDPEWAFDTGFYHGLHGGPQPIGGTWTWSDTGATTPIWDFICSGIENMK